MMKSITLLRVDENLNLKFATVPEKKSGVNTALKEEKSTPQTQEIKKGGKELELVVVEEISGGDGLTKVQGVITFKLF